MTIGIAASGRDAAGHVLRALRGVETLGSGAIGGFAVLALMARDGQVHYAETQDGGSAALRFPSEWLSCERAALISSGPNRPEPLQQFLPSLDGVGLVTGHRLPNRPFGDSRLNLAVLAGLQDGLQPREAIDTVLAAYPECDAGLMAVNAKGEVAYANSARVQRRKDIHSASLTAGGSTLAVMMNSIHFPSLAAQPAELICELALRTPPLTGGTGPKLLAFADGCPVVHAKSDRVIVDLQAGEVVEICNADPLVKHAQGRWPVIQNGCRAYTREGGALGMCLHDVVGNVRYGVVTALTGQAGGLRLVIGAAR